VKLYREGQPYSGRPQRAAAHVRQLAPGGEVTVTRIDRLARSIFGLFGGSRYTVYAF
jgi:hypothetical protein